MRDQLIKLVMPWRKGPFRFFGELIDAEWRSDMKWDRLLPELEKQKKGLKIADVGCGNGYFMLRSLALEPECIIGFDTVERYQLQFKIITAGISDQQLIKKLTLLPVRFDSSIAENYQDYFDLVLALGVYYHTRDPVLFFKDLKRVLHVGGKVIVEGLTTPGADSIHPERYLKMKNVYTVPTVSQLKEEIRLAGFSSVMEVSSIPLTTLEQRSTSFSPGESLAGFLDPTNPKLTIEGHLAPLRTIISAVREL